MGPEMEVMFKIISLSCIYYIVVDFFPRFTSIQQRPGVRVVVSEKFIQQHKAFTESFKNNSFACCYLVD